MSHDSQRVEIEQVRRKVSDWQIGQADYALRQARTAEHWLQGILRAFDMDAQTLVASLESDPDAGSVRALLAEQAFGLLWNQESHRKRFMLQSGRGESGLRLRYLRRLAGSTPTVWRVVGVDPGISVTVAPWHGEVALTVHDRKLSRHAEREDVLLTRVIDMPAGPMFGEAVIRVLDLNPATLPDSTDIVTYLFSYCVARILGLLALQETQGDGRSSERSRAGVDSRKPGASRPDTGRPTSDGSVPNRPAADPEHARVLERVRKLFAMAQESEASPHEAEIALRRCQSLMAKYGITEADLETSAFGNAEIGTGRTVPMHLKYLAAAVSRLHDVLFVTGRDGFAEFRGYDVDASVARLTLDYLLDAVERALTERKRAGDFPAGRSAAYDYRLGFASEVSRRVDALVEERLRAQRESVGTGTALAIRKREIVERECGHDLSSSSFRGRGARNAAARAAGHDDGARVSLDRQVGGADDLPALPGR